VYRWKGVRDAASQMGIRIRPELTLQLQRGATHPGPSLPEEGYENAQQLIATGRRFSALVAFNDISAIGAVRAFLDAGLRVPQDISVIGFDDIHGAAYLTPRLSTVRQPLRRMGEIAAEQLLAKIVNGGKVGAQQISVEPELVIRESTCECRQDDTVMLSIEGDREANSFGACPEQRRRVEASLPKYTAAGRDSSLRSE